MEHSVKIVKEYVSSMGKTLYWLTTENCNARQLARNRHVVLSIAEKTGCKKCAHLSIATGVGEISYPYCSKGSLCWEQKDFDTEIFQGCPQDCSYYEPIWRKKLNTTLKYFLTPFYWINKQETSTKNMFLSIILLYVLFRFAPDFLEVVIRLIR